MRIYLLSRISNGFRGGSRSGRGWHGEEDEMMVVCHVTGMRPCGFAPLSLFFLLFVLFC
jgi:hypothetical protein